MSLDVYLMKMQRVSIFDANYTHNCSAMAEEAGIHKCVWRPEEVGIKTAAQLIEPLAAGIALMKSATVCP